MGVPEEELPDLDKFRFRGLHENVLIGTASDRYAGWIGQVYSQGRYEGQLQRRPRTLGNERYTEEVVPVESVGEYFQHFPVLEIDFTFYRPLRDAAGVPTPTYHVLRQYCAHLGKTDRIVLKAPQALTARRLRREGVPELNKTFLAPGYFTQQFYQPAVELLGPRLGGIIFEQEYERKETRRSPQEVAEEWESFFSAAPNDPRYHLELRTEAYLSAPLFTVLEKYGVGQVLSHWTWLPPLRRQFAKAGNKYFSAAKVCIIRLLTPLGMRYEDAYAKAHPFHALVAGMLQEEMVEETAQLMWRGVREGILVNVIVNNRAGGNAPLISQRVARCFQQQGAKPQA